MSQEIPVRIAAVLAAVDSQESGRLVAVAAEDIVFRFANADPLHGHAGIEASSTAYNQVVAEVRHTVTDAWQPEPDVEVALADVAYRLHDGRSLTLPACTVLRFRDDLVIDYRIYMDASPVFGPA